MKFYHCIRSLSAVLLLASIAACAPLRLNSPSQLPLLPKNTGRNGGTIVPPTRWQYLGSDKDTHRFNYYYLHRDNVFSSCSVATPRTNTTLRFPEFPVGSNKQWVILAPDPVKFDFQTYREPTPSPHPATKKVKQRSTP